MRCVYSAYSESRRVLDLLSHLLNYEDRPDRLCNFRLLDTRKCRWYTGGAAGSGQEVIAPPKRKKPVDDVFSAAMELGARTATSEDVDPSVGAFSGGARTLAGKSSC